MEAGVGAGMKSNEQLLGRQGKWRCGGTVWQSWKCIDGVAHLHRPTAAYQSYPQPWQATDDRSQTQHYRADCDDGSCD